MLRKALIGCMIGLVAAAYVPAASWAIEPNGNVPVLNYAGKYLEDGNFAKFRGQLVGTGTVIPGTSNTEGGDSWLRTYDSETGEFVYLDEMVLEYLGQGSVIIFGQSLYNLLGEEAPTYEPTPFFAGFDNGIALLNDGKKVSGNCYFMAYIRLDGDASYEYGEGFYGEGNMLLIMGTAELNMKGYEDYSIRGRKTLSSTLIEMPPDVSDNPLKVKATLMPASSGVVYVEGGSYLGSFQPVAVRLDMGKVEFEPYFCCW